MEKSELQQEIVAVAKSFEGQREIQGNQGFNDAEFQNRMTEVGFYLGAAWCSFFAELVITQAFKNAGRDHKRIAALFSGSAVKTWANFSTSTDFKVGRLPEVGDVVIWQNFKAGKASWTGHAGIVIAVTGDAVVTMEGNTDSKGGREGIEVAKKNRKLDFTRPSGLRMLGFIKVAE